MNNKKLTCFMSSLVVVGCGAAMVTTIDFSDLETDQYILNGESFVSKGFTFSVEDFTSNDGASNKDGNVYLSPDEDFCNLSYTGGLGETMVIKESTVQLSPLTGTSHIDVTFADLSAFDNVINIEVNGEHIQARAFRDVFNTTIGGVTVSCIEECDDTTVLDGGAGTFALDGPITSFSFGGEYVCVLKMNIKQHKLPKK